MCARVSNSSTCMAKKTLDDSGQLDCVHQCVTVCLPLSYAQTHTHTHTHTHPPAHTNLHVEGNVYKEIGKLEFQVHTLTYLVLTIYYISASFYYVFHLERFSLFQKKHFLQRMYLSLSLSLLHYSLHRVV